RLLDGLPGPAALGGQGLGRHRDRIRSPERDSAPGRSWPTTDFATSAAAIAAARSTSTSTSLSVNRYTRSSVAMLPVAPGANAQPPSPPTEASSLVTPEPTAA